MAMSLLWVEDDAALRRVYRPLLRGEGFEVREAIDAPAARRAFAADPTAIVLLDLMLPPDSTAAAGVGLLRELLAVRPTTKVIVLTGSGDRRIAVDAIRHGAFDFLHKPVDPDVLAVVLQRAASRVRLEAELSGLRDALASRDPANAMIGQSPVFLQSVELADRVAPTTLPVLITGENGTGKELMAKRVHQHSARADGPFVTINCGALPPTLLESTLFGHVRGAFTGASHDRPGLFVEASGGTLFLDEIGDTEAATQVRLLRAIETQEVLPVGSDRPTTVDVRFISATNRDLDALMREGAFRDDLYWRLKGVEIGLPPLRDRGDDILLLARHMLAVSAPMVGRLCTLTAEAETALLQHAWPGNGRELRHALQRGAVLAGTDARIAPEHLGLRVGDAPDGRSLAEQVERLERRAIGAALAAEGGNRTRAAEALGLSRQGLLNKIARYGLTG
ncbi:MAG: DNA-binding NtrC family response regulator [Myxococcota bacterium]|jgi:DNA-binding NtrC family response regulator